MPRQYISNDVWSTVTTEAGTLAVHPVTAGRLIFDAACANHIPAYALTGMHGSTVLDIGRGVIVRVSGYAEKAGAEWELGDLYVCRAWSARSVTREMQARAEALVFDMLQQWAPTHAGDIAQADDIDRNNGARQLEGAIAEHERALLILREQLEACNEGAPYSQYPDLPTGRR